MCVCACAPQVRALEERIQAVLDDVTLGEEEPLGPATHGAGSSVNGGKKPNNKTKGGSGGGAAKRR